MSSLRGFVIYSNTSDFPGKFVIREWVVACGQEFPKADPLVIADTLEEARKALPPGLTMIPRFNHDDPCIVEGWI